MVRKSLDRPKPRTYWSIPTPYGYFDALNAFGTTAAPLLAGFGVALIGLAVGLKTDSPVRYPGVALASVAVSVLLLLGSVQCSMWARQYAVTPAEMFAWWPDAHERQEDLRTTQWRYSTIGALWLRRARAMYQFGLVALLLGLLAILIPKEWSPSRIAAEVIVGLGVCLEVLWIYLPRRRRYRLVRTLFPTPMDLTLNPPPVSEVVRPDNTG